MDWTDNPVLVASLRLRRGCVPRAACLVLSPFDAFPHRRSRFAFETKDWCVRARSKKAQWHERETVVVIPTPDDTATGGKPTKNRVTLMPRVRAVEKEIRGSDRGTTPLIDTQGEALLWER